MCGVRRQRYWLGIVTLAFLFVAGGVWWAWARPSLGLVEQGLKAYARGDWEESARLARVRLNAVGNDRGAMRLLARSSVRMGRDTSAMAMFKSLGPESMSADDLCLLGIALARSGNSKGAVQVWEQARSADPNHWETLFELTRAYATGDRLMAAVETGRPLAARPGWEARTEALLGAIELELNDPAGAIAFWRRALEHGAAVEGGTSPPAVPRKELARALLRTGQPDEARRLLQNVLAAAPDPEGFWLMSRAHLQRHAMTDALVAWEQAGSFRDENPLLPEPARFVGSEVCAKCHVATYRAQQKSRHARTFFRVSELAELRLPPQPFADPAQPKVAHNLKRLDGERLQQETRAGGLVFRAMVDYAFGSGDRGLTLVGRDDHGRARTSCASLIIRPRRNRSGM